MAYLDEGLAVFRKQWKAEHPKAVVYWIADDKHSQNPRVSQHAPDDGKSGGAGDDIGEVDAVDVMPGSDVTEADLQELFDGLVRERDPRLLIAIYKRKIVSSVVKPWVVRDYTGDYHSHVHISVNDLFDKNEDLWKWEPMTEQVWKYRTVDGAKLPEKLTAGMEDAAFSGTNHVSRAQALLNYLNRPEPLTIDGVYGAKTAAKARKVFGGTGRTLTFENLRKLHGI